MSTLGQDAATAVEPRAETAGRSRSTTRAGGGPAQFEDATVLPRPEPEPDGPEERRRTQTFRRTDLLALVGAGCAALGTAALLFNYLTPFTGILGFMIVAFLAFVLIYGALVSFDEDGPTVGDRLMSVAIHSMGLVLLVALAVVVGYTFWRGWDALTNLNFFTQDFGTTGPLDPLTSGGILHAMIGTLEQITIALAVVIPLGIACAVFLSEIPGRFSGFVRTIVEAMTALPSIVAGLFIYATLIVALGGDGDSSGGILSKSGFAASLAISVMMLPIVIRAADVVLRLVPGTLREASLALGGSQWHTVWHVVLPTARSGLTTAIILGTARGIGETSPVLLTAGYTANLNLNAFQDPQVSLPLVTFILIQLPQEIMKSRAFGAAAALMIVVLLLFILARVVGGRGPGQHTRWQRRRHKRASAREARRFAQRRGHGSQPIDHSQGRS